MNTLTVESPVVVITDGETSLIITDANITEFVDRGKSELIERSIIIKDTFMHAKGPLFCHVFPTAKTISYNLLVDTEHVIETAIRFNPGKD